MSVIMTLRDVALVLSKADYSSERSIIRVQMAKVDWAKCKIGQALLGFELFTPRMPITLT